MSWLYGRPIEPTLEFLELEVRRSGRRSPRRTRARSAPATRSARRARPSLVTYEVKPAPPRPGTYRNITGNQALALGLVAASKLSHGPPLFLGATRSRRRRRSSSSSRARSASASARSRPRTRSQPCGAALGAAFGGALGVTTSAGPGVVLKAETDRPRGDARAAAPDHRRPARRPLDWDADEAGAGRPADGALRPQLASRRCPSSRARRRATASTPRSRPRASHSSTARPSTCSPHAYLANGSEPWLLPEARRAPRHLRPVRGRVTGGEVPAVPARRGDARAASAEHQLNQVRQQ